MDIYTIALVCGFVLAIWMISMDDRKNPPLFRDLPRTREDMVRLCLRAVEFGFLLFSVTMLVVRSTVLVYVSFVLCLMQIGFSFAAHRYSKRLAYEGLVLVVVIQYYLGSSILGQQYWNSK